MKHFYVTMIRDTRVAWLAGPFAEHQQALDLVEPARQATYKVDPRSAFDAFGTSSIDRDPDLPPPRAGVLNSALGIH